MTEHEHDRPSLTPHRTFDGRVIDMEEVSALLGAVYAGCTTCSALHAELVLAGEPAAVWELTLLYFGQLQQEALLYAGLKSAGVPCEEATRAHTAAYTMLEDKIEQDELSPGWGERWVAGFRPADKRDLLEAVTHGMGAFRELVAAVS